jgi:hypothetical protein
MLLPLLTHQRLQKLEWPISGRKSLDKVMRNYRWQHTLKHIGQNIRGFESGTLYLTLHFEKFLDKKKLVFSRNFSKRTWFFRFHHTKDQDIRRKTGEMIGNSNHLRNICFNLYDTTIKAQLKRGSARRTSYYIRGCSGKNFFWI